MSKGLREKIIVADLEEEIDEYDLR